MSETRPMTGVPKTAPDHESQTTSGPRIATVRGFLGTEAGGAVVLLVAAIIALAWSNSPWRDSYAELWATEASITLGDASLRLDLAHWVSDGLMALFFLLIGLEVRREFDVGEFRERRRVAVPVIAALGGMALPVAIFLALNPPGEAARGWAMVMATDTAFAVGVLALVGRRSSLRLRIFLLTLVVVDDIAAVGVIAVVYTSELDGTALAVAIGLLGVMAVLRRRGVRPPAVYVFLTLATWLATLQSGVHATVAGVAVGLLTPAYQPNREALRDAIELARNFRRTPSSKLASAAGRGMAMSLSPNDRAQHVLHPWTSYVVVPVFVLANAGVDLGGDIASRVLGSPLTLGIVLGLVVGKTVGIPLGAWLATRHWLGGLPLVVGWPSLIAASSVAGIGFTVSLLIADLSYTGPQLEAAKLGVLIASVTAALLSIAMFLGLGLLPHDWLRRADARAAPAVPDLVDPVDPVTDHVRGPADALVTLVEYGDYECPYCGRVAPAIARILERSDGRVRFVMRHLPLTEVHPSAALAAEAAEAAGAQGRFWEMHDLLFAHQDALSPADLRGHAEALGLDVAAFERDIAGGRFRGRVARDVASADAAGVTGTPTFFINEVRIRRGHDPASLEAAVRAADRLAGDGS